MKVRFFLIGILCILLQGCWMRLPSRGPDAIRPFVGKTATVKKPLYIYKHTDGTSSSRQDKASSADPNGLIAVLPPGTKVKVVSIVSRRLPPGLFYYFVLRSTAPNTHIEFDHPCGGAPLHTPYPDATLTFDE
jgi:hypothetical protein